MADHTPKDGDNSHRPSAKFVLMVLEQNGGRMTRSEILDAACQIYQPPTIEGALKELREAGAVKRATSAYDGRRVVYELSE